VIKNNFIIVLFKNKKKKKIIKGFITEERAIEKFKSLIKENDVRFEVQYENAEKSYYELGLLTKLDDRQKPIYQEDDFGRNQEVFIETESEYKFREIKPYKLEEKIFDWRKNKRISFDELISKYCVKKEMKSISTLHNKLVIQINELFFLFSLKNVYDSHRLLETMEKYYRETGRNDAIFVKDMSTTQRKWLYDILIEKGFDKGLLYRQTTTFSKRT
jgi:hypothetical protein